MRKSLHLFLLSCVFSIISVTAESPSWNEDIKSISQAVAAKKDKPRVNQAQIDQCLKTIQSSLHNKNYHLTLSKIHMLNRLEPASMDAGVALSEKLLKELIKQSKQEIEHKENLFKKFAQAMLGAKKTSDIDPWLVKLNAEALKDKPTGFSSQTWNPLSSSYVYPHRYRNYWSLNRDYQNHCGHTKQLRTHTDNALKIAGYWQDYLQHLSTGNFSGAQSPLRYIASITTKFVYIPRSKVLALEAEISEKASPKKAKAITTITMPQILKRLQTKDSAIVLYNEIRSLSSSKMDPTVKSFREYLSTFKSGLTYLDAGNLSSGFDKLNSLSQHPQLGALAKKTSNQYLATYLKVPDTFAIKNNETTQVWSMRYLKQLADQEAWHKLLNALKVMSQYYPRHSSGINNPTKADLEATQYFIAGHNYESSKQYLRAIVAYRQALGKTGNLKKITDEAGKRLLKLQQAHPTEHAQSQSLSRHDSTSGSFTTSHTLIRKIVQEEVKKALSKPKKK